MKLTTALLLLAPLGVSAFGPAKQPLPKSAPAALNAALSPKEPPNMFNAMGNLWNREVASAFTSSSSSSDVIIEPDFTLAWLFALSGAFIYFNNLGGSIRPPALEWAGKKKDTAQPFVRI